MHRRHLREEAALAAVGALVEHEARPARDQRPVAAGAGLELDHHALAPVADDGELLPAREDELHRPAGGSSERGDVALEVEVALRAEPAAEQRDDDADVRLGNLERVRDAGPRGIGNLGRRPDGHLAALPLGDDRPRLDGNALRAVADVAALDDHLRVRHGRIGIPLDDRRVAERVAVAHHLVVGRVGLPVLVHELGVVVHRGLEVDDGRKGLVVDRDQAGRLLGDLGRDRGHAGDDVALPANLLLREEPPVLTIPPYFTSGTSSCVRTASTPGSARAFEASMRVMRACV